MPSRPLPLLLVLLTASFLPATLPAQMASSTAAPSLAPAPTPTTPTAPRSTFHDPSYKISFDYPANWIFSKRDGEISTFHLEARSAPHSTHLRAVAAIPENPYPASTFSGAHLYLSVTPHTGEASCASQAAPAAKPSISKIAGISFAHGHDEQKHICTTDRDEIYTTYHRGACYRFDLAINNFCGGEVSSVKDITPQELDNVRHRMESILATVRFDPK